MERPRISRGDRLPRRVRGAPGNCYAKRGRYDLAFPYLKKADELEHHSARLRHDYGAVCWSLGDIEEAERRFGMAVSLEPDSAQSHLLLAKALLALGRRNEAKEHLERYLSIDPDNIEAKRLLGG